MAVRLVKGLSETWFKPTLLSDDSEDENRRTEFLLKPLSQIQLMECLVGVRSNRFQARDLERAFGWGVVGWKNVVDPDGNEVEFSEADKWSLPGDLIAVLGRQVIINSQLTEAEAKN